MFNLPSFCLYDFLMTKKINKWKIEVKYIFVFLNTDRVVFPDIDQAEQNEFNL